MTIISRIDTALKGTPDSILTAILVSLGLLAIGVAIFADPALKAILATWFILP